MPQESINACPLLKDTSFMHLMTRRICNVLIIANPYDAFMLEDDGRVDEKIFDEYAKLGLRYPPRFTQAASAAEAEDELSHTSFDLVICMPGAEDNDVFCIARDIKQRFSHIPLVVLTPFSHGITGRMQNEDLSIFEYVFCWLGNTDLLLSIIKLIEDKMNLEHDVHDAGVQMILLVEDSIRYYSSILPNLYKFVLQQSLEFATEALNSQLEMLRMRGRPKIVLARNYEEAWQLYSRYRQHTLGVISDCRFPREGQTDELAGYKLLSAMRASDPFLPLIMQSSETEKIVWAQRCGAAFIDKNSKKPADDLRQLVLNNFGFGDFIFRKPGTRHEEVRIRNLKDLQDNIFTLPQESLLYHIRRNNVSRWLGSRALFPISEFLRDITWDSLQDIDAHRQIIFDAIVRYRRMKNQGVVAVFNRHRFDQYSNFARIGDGSLGGKGRGLAFLDHIIMRHPDLNDLPGASVQLPKTVVLCTDVFDEFMEKGNLYPIALSDAPNDEILQAFLDAPLPERLHDDLVTYLQVVTGPIAIRSSSLLEDAHYQPFAGIYSTYMIPPADDLEQRLQLLSGAVKGVYASVYYSDSKAYMAATRNVIDQEKMAVLLQEVVGTAYEGRYYPHISGVARSLNYYPIGDEQATDGIADLALGLGKYIVDGGLSLRVCPAYPHKVLQTSEMEMALRQTQTRFYALDMTQTASPFQVDDGFNLLKLPVQEAVKDGAMRFTASTYDPYDMVIRDGVYDGGRKLVTFSGVLQHGVFPLPKLLQLLLEYGREEMRREVEVEFAVKLADDRTGVFYPLQIRPMVTPRMQLDEDLTQIADDKVLLHSHHAIGHGVLPDVCDVVYVKTEGFSAAHNPQVADEIESVNRKLVAEGRPYILIGPGRWGSSDPWLGIPVKWPHISGAKVIVEAGLSNYRIDPSQGTHFFQNLTSFGVAYYTIDDYKGDGVYHYHLLQQQPAVDETAHVRHVRFDKPLVVKTDGMKKEGVVIL
ncbi:MAG: PEP/pyruvate-binding domain-containing protein [Bacteroidales bacterium]|nr:PEP/pyruvate-binding domain-containing protein [Bacteroidales bacterium]